MEIVEASPCQTVQTKKQVWDGQQFVHVIMHRFPGVPNQQQIDWLTNNIGRQKTYTNRGIWFYSTTGNWTCMDEKTLCWYMLKWKQQ